MSAQTRRAPGLNPEPNTITVTPKPKRRQLTRPDTEWRVRWRHDHWRASTCDQTRVFQREHAARALAGRLRENGARCWIDERRVGPWRRA